MRGGLQQGTLLTRSRYLSGYALTRRRRAPSRTNPVLTSSQMVEPVDISPTSSTVANTRRTTPRLLSGFMQKNISSINLWTIPRSLMDPRSSTILESLVRHSYKGICFTQRSAKRSSIPDDSRECFQFRNVPNLPPSDIPPPEKLSPPSR